MQRLDALSIPDPRVAGIMRTLQVEGHAWIDGGPGSGRTTTAHQVMQAWPARATLVDGNAMLRDDTSSWLRHIMQGLGATRPPQEPDLDMFRRGLHGRARPLVVLDGHLAAEVAEGIMASPAAVLRTDGNGPPADHDARTLRSFMERRAASAGRTWDHPALDACLEAAAGSIAAAQRIGYHACPPRTSGAITEEDAIEAIGAAAWEPPAGLRDRLARTSNIRRRLLLAMAREPAAAPSTWGRRCDVPQASVPVHLARLVEEGLCRREGRGRYAIASPLLMLHLQAVYGTASYGTSRRR